MQPTPEGKEKLKRCTENWLKNNRRYFYNLLDKSTARFKATK